MRPRRAAASILSGTLALTLMGVAPGLPSPAGAAPVPDSEDFVRRVNFDLLNDADPTQATIDSQIAAVGTTTGSRFVSELQASEAGRGAIIDDTYEDVLRRNADPAGRAFFVESLGQGFSSLRLTATFLGSNEYFAKRGGGTDSGFLDALYVDALGRSADADGKAYFLDQLAQGRTRSSVASFFVLGSEGRTVLVRGLYTDLLRRTGDVNGVTFYAEMIRQGTTRERIVTFLVSSAEYRNKAQADLGNERIIVLTADNNLVFTSTANAEAIERVVPVLGLPEGTTLLGMDIRPSNGVLYGVASNGQVVTINQGSGFTNLVGVPIPDFDPSDGVGVDFNPAADALRVVTGTDNYRVNPTTGALANGTPDGTLTFTPGDINQGKVPNASGAGYTNSTRGLPLPAATELYDIDETTSSLVQQVPANDGTLVTKGKLRLDASAVNGFDISPDGNQNAYALLDAPNAGSGIWRVDLATGEPRLISTGAPEGAIGLAVIGDEVVAPTETLYAVRGDSLLVFSSADPAPTATKPVTGFDEGATLVGIDVRPATGELFGLSSNGRLYTVDISGDQAVATIANALIPPLAQFDPAAGVGFDFNPAADAIRVTNGTRNYRLLTNGLVVGEGPPNTFTPGSLQYVEGDVNAGATPAVAGSAYTNSGRSATRPTATALFDVDTDLDVLVRQNPANDGNLITIGSLGVDVTAASIDISGGLGQTTYAVLTVDGATGLYLVDLASGDAELLQALPDGTPVTAFSVA